MIIANYLAGNIGVHLGNGNGSFINQSMYPVDSKSHLRGIAIGDFNKDTKLDFVVGSFDNNNLVVFLGYGNGLF